MASRLRHDDELMEQGGVRDSNVAGLERMHLRLDHLRYADTIW